MVGAGEAVRDFESFARFHKPGRVSERLNVLQAGRVNLVDGDVDVQMIGVDMHGADALMVGKADCLAKLIFNRVQHVERRILARRETENEVIGLIGL